MPVSFVKDKEEQIRKHISPLEPVALYKAVRTHNSTPQDVIQSDFQSFMNKIL